MVSILFLVRQAAQRASKRVKISSSDTEEDSDNSVDSEFKISGDSDTPESESQSEDSNPSSDCNPFYSDSDSDAGMFFLNFLKQKKFNFAKIFLAFS